MSPDQLVQGRAPIHQQLSFDDLAELEALRASDEANADAVISELLAVPLRHTKEQSRPVT